jgi:hypothetical protein
MSDAPAESDTASHGAPKPAVPRHGELRHTLTVHDVEAALVAAGVPRSHRQVIRYCETGMLDAVKVPGPTGAQWFVSPASLPKAIGDLQQWEAQRAGHGVTEPDMSGRVTLAKAHNDNSDTARHGTPEPAMSDKEISQKGSVTEPAMARHSTTELDVYDHPYVKKLEERNEKLEAKYEAQVRRTEEIQLKSQEQLLELQRMTAVGQSETLADFMLKAKDWMLGGPAEPAKREADDLQTP